MGAVLAMKPTFAIVIAALSLSACSGLPALPTRAKASNKVVVLNTQKVATPTIRVFLESRGASAVLTAESTLGSVTNWTYASGVSVELNQGLLV